MLDADAGRHSLESRRAAHLAIWALLPAAGALWLLLLLASNFSALVVALGLLLGVTLLTRA